jgi:tetratricopeptide (TPR) repeat protein
MMDAERVLRPLREQEAAIERLETYASAGDLADAIASVREALEQSVRLMLRADEGAPEEARLAALARGTSLDAVVTALRRRDRLSMELAGRLHEVDGIHTRLAAGGEARATDADAVLTAVRLLFQEVTTPTSAPARIGLTPPPELEEWHVPAEPEGRGGLARTIGVGALVLVAVVALLLIRSGTDPRAEAIAAFRAGDLDTARRGFEVMLGDDSVDITALLYLGRIHRRENRADEAAVVLRTAAERAPDDADVRRELGWLFLDLGRPESAAQQFEHARTAAPSDARNWIGLVRALRAAGDPRAEQVLRDAPPEARAALSGAGM